ncbi:MAG: redox-regulated ATPase YchF [Thermofilum sp. ex4484_79]|nr:MAG: redox-regulated ATPase YchF [Thermofilum sp. ex4484_79]
MVVEIGVVGKPNAGKSTFFAASTLIDVKRAPYPFTTINPNIGIGYAKLKCVCKEFGVQDNPKNSFCINGWRFAPVELMDVAGLVPGAWKGRGLGNKFLDELRRANALIHVIDISGSTDVEGRPLEPGKHDPLEDVFFLEKEIDMWMFQILQRDWDRTSRIIDIKSSEKVKELYERLSGLGIKIEVIEKALQELGLQDKKASSWSEDDLFQFVSFIRKESKPMLLAANKIDLPFSEENFNRLEKELGDKYVIIPMSAEAELALRKASKAGLIEYVPGEKSFRVIKNLTPKQEKALDYIRERVLEKWGSTGVQQAIDMTVFNLLNMIAIFPVENENKLTDHSGNVLPDVHLVPKGITAKEFAYNIHSELGEKFAFAIDVRNKKRLPADYRLEHRCVIKIVISR